MVGGGGWNRSQINSNKVRGWNVISNRAFSDLNFRSSKFQLLTLQSASSAQCAILPIKIYSAMDSQSSWVLPEALVLFFTSHAASCSLPLGKVNI